MLPFHTVCCVLCHMARTVTLRGHPKRALQFSRDVRLQESFLDQARLQRGKSSRAAEQQGKRRLCVCVWGGGGGRGLARAGIHKGLCMAWCVWLCCHYADSVRLHRNAHAMTPPHPTCTPAP